MERDLSSDGLGKGGGWRGLVAQLRQATLFRHILTAISGSAGAQLINLALIPVIMRIYGPDAFGVVGAFQSLSIILIPACALTYPIAIVLPKSDSDSRGLIKVSLVMAAIVAIITALVFFFFGERIADRLNLQLLTPYLMLLPMVMFTSAALEITQQWLYRNHKFTLTARATTAHALCYNSLRTVGGWLQNSAPMLVITSSLYYLINTLMLLIGMSYKRVPHVPDPAEPPPKSFWVLAREYRDFPLYRAPQVLINALSVHMPTLVLASAFGAVPAGYFALCLQVLSMPSNFIGKAVSSVFYPRIARAIHARESVTGLLLKGVAALGGLGLIPFATLAIAGPWLFHLAFGDHWTNAGEYARWLAIAELTGFMNLPCLAAAPALSLQKTFLIFEVFSTSLRVGGVLLGAFVFKDAMAVVKAFAAANITVNLLAILIVLIASKRWYGRQLPGPVTDPVLN